MPSSLVHANRAALLALGSLLAGSGLAAQDADQPGEGVWRNYDFTPGRTVWVATDFSREPVGRFPASQLEFVSGNMQIVEVDGEKALEVSAASVFRLALPEELKPDFSLEFTIRLAAPNQGTYVFFGPVERSISQYASQYVYVVNHTGIYQGGRAVSSIQTRQLNQGFTPIRLQADGEYLLLYVGNERAANIPNSNLPRSGAIEFRLAGNQRLKTYIKDIVVAVGIDKLYEALMESGEFTTRGILFDVDSDALRPESTPVLEELRRTLAEHEDLSVLVEGHTDNTGADDHNLGLSERRARSVVGWLVANGIAESRLRAEGKGETAPVADNATPEGRAQNRRVVIRRVQ